MDNKTFNGQISVATSALKFKYSDGNFGLFNNWNDLLAFWSPYYDNNWTVTDCHFRKTAYGVAVIGGTEIMAAPVSGPLTKAQKADLMTRAAEYINNR